jgi:CNT family concentrative nucleoside transporter
MDDPGATSDVTRLRVMLAAGVAVIAATAFVFQDTIPGRVRAGLGVICFIGLVITCSSNIRAINWRTVGWGIVLQFLFAILILRFEVGDVRPGYALFSSLAAVVTQFLAFTDVGSTFVFGVLASHEDMGNVFPNGFVLAFAALPIIIFVSSVFTVLYYFGFLQILVRVMARVMMPLMGTSGAETLSVAANVFMGQTEAPLIVRPFIPAMTRSELLTLMTGGLATIAGSVLGVYLSLGADPVAMLTTSVMAAPCALYLSKILLPESGRPVTIGDAEIVVGTDHVNVIDAAASGAADGMRLAINVAAMLIAFLAFVAMVDYTLGLLSPELTLTRIFGVIFSPVAVLLGVSSADVPALADLLGTKLVTNEFVAYVKLDAEYEGVISDRSHTLATFALTGFANFGSVGVILGGIGGMSPERRSDLARLSSRALFAGFVATLINAAIAGLLI